MTVNAARPLRVLVVPPPDQAGAAPWGAVIDGLAARWPLRAQVSAGGTDDGAGRAGAAVGGAFGLGEPQGPGAGLRSGGGVELAVISSGDAVVPVGVLHGIAAASPAPPRGNDVAQRRLEEQVRYGEAVANALGGLAAAGFVPDVAITDVGSGAALLLCEAVPDLPVVARLAGYARPVPAARAGRRFGPASRAERAGLVVADFALAHHQVVVCPSDEVRAAVPAPFLAVCEVVPDGLAPQFFAEVPRPAPAASAATAGAGQITVAVLLAEGEGRGGRATGPAQPGAANGEGAATAELLGPPWPAVLATLGSRSEGGPALAVRLVPITADTPVARRVAQLAGADVAVVACPGHGGAPPADLVAQAQATCGLVVSDRGGALRHGTDGYVADLSDPAHTAAVLAYVLHHRRALEGVRAAARAGAAMWAPEAVAARYLALATEAASGARPGPRLPSSRWPGGA